VVGVNRRHLVFLILFVLMPVLTLVALMIILGSAATPDRDEEGGSTWLGRSVRSR
jgi:hypothetical protein